MTFFVDTNFFFQCKKYDELKWSEITNDKDITILITRPVQIEIDKLKNDGNTRRSKRARETTSLFRKILGEDNMSFITEIPNNSITFKFAKQYSDESLSQTNPSLDMSNTDDKILAILHNYILDGLINVDSCAFLSNDTNPILTAKLNNLPVIQIPGTWLLEPENDDRDKEILKLNQQVLEFQKKEPLIEVEFDTNDYITSTKVHNEFIVKILRYNQIAQSDIEELVASLIKKHPKKNNFEADENGFSKSLQRAINPMQTYYPPDNEEIEKYNAAYQNWENDIYDLFSCYADKHNKFSNIVPFDIILKNTGNISAENLLVIFEILAGGQLVFPDFDDTVMAKRWAYPTPPDPPKGKRKYNTLFAMDRIAAAQSRLISHNLAIPPITLRDMIVSNKHDKNRFYWKDGRPKENTSLWRFECDEFRHKLDDKQFPYYLAFNEDSEKVIFKVKISATNMSTLLEKVYTLQKKYIYIETKNEILHLVEYGVTEKVMRKIEGTRQRRRQISSIKLYPFHLPLSVASIIIGPLDVCIETKLVCPVVKCFFCISNSFCISGFICTDHEPFPLLNL